jgi:N-acetylneuraminic acid mutarotase
VEEAARINPIRVGFLSMVLLAGSSLLFPAKSHDVSFHWTKSTPFREATSGYAAGVIQGKFVIAGGTYWEGTANHWKKKVFSSATYLFDPTTQEWQRLANLPVPLGYPASAAVDNRLFVLGGYNGHNANREIFTLTKEGNEYVWKTFGKLPFDRIFGKAVTIGKDIYLVGGSTQFEPLDAIGTCCTSKTATNSLLVFNLARPERGWRELAPYPGATRWLFSAEGDGKAIWMFGGRYQANPKDPLQLYPEVLRYSPVDAKWKLMTYLPIDLWGTSSVTAVFADGRMLLIGSIGKTWQLDLNLLKYEELAPLPEAVEVDKFVWLANHVIGSGGENSTDDGPRRRSESTFIGQFGPD